MNHDTFCMDTIFLSPGFHAGIADEYCITEAACVQHGIEFSEITEFIAPELVMLLQAINDWELNDAKRQELKQLGSRIILTGGLVSPVVRKVIGQYFEWSYQYQDFLFTMPEDPIGLVNWCVDMLLFEADMADHADQQPEMLLTL